MIFFVLQGMVFSEIIPVRRAGRRNIQCPCYTKTTVGADILKDNLSRGTEREWTFGNKTTFCLLGLMADFLHLVFQ